jgi:hypothetical protein
VVVTVSYDDADWQSAGGAGEQGLGLYRWDGSVWQPTAPCADCAHDPDANTIRVALNRPGELALLVDGPQGLRNFLPLLRG